MLATRRLATSNSSRGENALPEIQDEQSFDRTIASAAVGTLHLRCRKRDVAIGRASTVEPDTSDVGSCAVRAFDPRGPQPGRASRSFGRRDEIKGTGMSTYLSRVASAAAVTLSMMVCSPAFAQRPSDPALLIPQEAAEMDYVAVANPLIVPAGMVTGAPSSVAFDKQGNIWVLYRGTQPFVEFDKRGKFLRAFGEGLFVRPHGLKFDNDGNMWATDVDGHIVYKVSTRGRILLKLGTGEQSGLINEPNDIAVAANGDVFIAQGHTPGDDGDPRVVKFDKDGHFIKSWGGKGSGPGQFQVAHGISIDAHGRLWVADRENQRIQIFDQDGNYIREMKYAGLPCSLQIGDQYVYMVNGFAGQVLRLDLDGKVLAATGKAGTGLGEFGEAHAIAVSKNGEIWVADSINSVVHKFVKK
jgi:sugar lactone lactonase YvrE